MKLRTHVLRIVGTCALGLVCSSVATAADWKPVPGTLMTKWAKDVSPERVLPEYPRPQLVRERWQSLNGLWKYAIRPKAESEPGEWDGDILVPFCVESALSGVRKPVSPDERLWYVTAFGVPSDWAGSRVLLHFGAVDWEATVWVNGQKLGAHRGGYDPFSFDITDALTKQGPNRLTIAVWDPTDAGHQPRGKQVLKPHGIWYTAVTGIWQSVWLEPVPAQSIRALKIVPDVDHSQLRVTATTSGDTNAEVVVEALEDEQTKVASALGKPGEPVVLDIKNARLWSPDSPNLYDLTVALRVGGKTVDTARSYFGMRKIDIQKDERGINRLFLNNKPLFHFGPLDQGWWPDGLYTAPTEDALVYDIVVTRDLGFNMARKHVKVEPDAWYAYCDFVGLMVWQDMPSGDRSIRPDEADITRTTESAADYRRELQAMIDSRSNHPSIVGWVPFNEGWGQFETDEVLKWTKEYDPTRLVDGPSGWTDRGTGEMHDKHEYPGPGMFPTSEGRVSVLGEFGGLGLPIEGRLWDPKMRNWGYRTYRTANELNENYVRVVAALRPLIGRGLAAAVYTQTTDVESEVNGLMTYDRAIIKLETNLLRSLHHRLYAPPPLIATLVPDSRNEPQTWRFAEESPADDWMKPEFDDAAWSEAPGGFGTSGTPGAEIGHEWQSKQIWLRRKFDLPSVPQAPQLTIHHDEDAVVYLNGVPAATLKGYTTGYINVPIGPEAAAGLHQGANTIAVHCRQTGGGQYIDVGLEDVVEPEQAR